MSRECTDAWSDGIASPGDDSTDTGTTMILEMGAVAVNVNFEATKTVDETRLFNNDDGAV